MWAKEGAPNTILQARERKLSPNEDVTNTYCTEKTKTICIGSILTTYGHVFTFFMNEGIMCPKSLLLSEDSYSSLVVVP